MPRMMIYLSDEEIDALQILSGKERRNTREQAAVLVRDGLERAGIIGPYMQNEERKNEPQR